MQSSGKVEADMLGCEQKGNEGQWCVFRGSQRSKTGRLSWSQFNVALCGLEGARSFGGDCSPNLEIVR